MLGDGWQAEPGKHIRGTYGHVLSPSLRNAIPEVFTCKLRGLCCQMQSFSHYPTLSPKMPPKTVREMLSKLSWNIGPLPVTCRYF